MLLSITSSFGRCIWKDELMQARNNPIDVVPWKKHGKVQRQTLPMPFLEYRNQTALEVVAAVIEASNMVAYVVMTVLFLSGYFQSQRHQKLILFVYIVSILVQILAFFTGWILETLIASAVFFQIAFPMVLSLYIVVELQVVCAISVLANISQHTLRNLQFAQLGVYLCLEFLPGLARVIMLIRNEHDPNLELLTDITSYTDAGFNFYCLIFEIWQAYTVYFSIQRHFKEKYVDRQLLTARDREAAHVGHVYLARLKWLFIAILTVDFSCFSMSLPSIISVEYFTIGLSYIGILFAFTHGLISVFALQTIPIAALPSSVGSGSRPDERRSNNASSMWRTSERASDRSSVLAVVVPSTGTNKSASTSNELSVVRPNDLPGTQMISEIRSEIPRSESRQQQNRSTVGNQVAALLLTDPHMSLGASPTSSRLKEQDIESPKQMHKRSSWDLIKDGMNGSSYSTDHTSQDEILQRVDLVLVPADSLLDGSIGREQHDCIYSNVQQRQDIGQPQILFCLESVMSTMTDLPFLSLSS
ncbi:hypothetical protein EDD86DRAFT_219833 [Gorgonomyces haynaldii]|nr:hypothetical protein EDD86DRAFT_219833 [Gorgonomyces haynaldii]